MGSLWTSNFDSFWMLFVYCLCRLCIHMVPEGGGHVFYMLRVHFSVALFTSFYASPVIICGWDKQMKSLENDLEQHGTVRNGLDYNSYVWRNAERSADIYKVAQTVDTKTKVSSCSWISQTCQVSHRQFVKCADQQRLLSRQFSRRAQTSQPHSFPLTIISSPQ